MTYLSTVLADAPVHYWRQADGGSQLAYDIGSSKEVLGGQGGSGYTGPNSDGGSRYCDGSVNKGVVSAVTLAWSNPFSVEMWFWPTGNAAAAGALLAWDNNAANSIVVAYQPNTTVTFQLTGSAALASAVTTRQHWHHMVATWNGATMRLYVDAIQTNQAFVSAITGNKLIGWGENPVGGTNGFNGAIAECATYASILSPTQVNNHFLAADQTTLSPIFKGQGSFDISAGIFTGDPETLATILSSVRKTYVAP